MVEVIKKEINNPMWSWTARFITDKNIVLATSCENHTEIYLYSPEGLSKASKNKGINNSASFNITITTSISTSKKQPNVLKHIRTNDCYSRYHLNSYVNYICTYLYTK